MKTADIVVGKPYRYGNPSGAVVIVVGVKVPWRDLGRDRKDGIRVCATEDVLDGWKKKGDEWTVAPKHIVSLASVRT